MTTARRLLNPNVVFSALAILINAFASHLAHTTLPAGVQAAACFDLTITVTLFYYWLLVRPGLRSAKSLIFVALLGLWRASLLFPSIVPGTLWIGASVEGAVLITIFAGLWRSRHASTNGDPLERLRATLAAIVPIPVVARVMASEFSVFYYALNWRARPYIPAGSQAFTMHKRTMAGDLFYCMSLVSLLEIVPVHLLINRWSHTAAWILTVLSLYGALWLIAMARAFHLRPSLIGPDGITIRYGMLFQVHATDYRIVSEATANAVIVPRNTPPTVYLEFPEPVEASMILGIPKKLTAIGISPDSPDTFDQTAASLRFE
jgi:hypothetical protein